MSALRWLFSRIHRDERGAVSLETILIVGAIALPTLIFLVKVGWPKVRSFFDGNIQELERETDTITGGGRNDT